MTNKDLKKTITKAELFKKYKPNEICFVVTFLIALDESLMTDIPATFFVSLKKAEEESKRTGESVFAYTRKYAKECFDPHTLYEDLIDNVNQEGFDFPYSVEAKKEFEKITRCWFDKHVGNVWFADAFIGRLVE